MSRGTDLEDQDAYGELGVIFPEDLLKSFFRHSSVDSIFFESENSPLLEVC